MSALVQQWQIGFVIEGMTHFPSMTNLVGWMMMRSLRKHFWKIES